MQKTCTKAGQNTQHLLDFNLKLKRNIISLLLLNFDCIIIGMQNLHKLNYRSKDYLKFDKLYYN